MKIFLTTNNDNETFSLGKSLASFLKAGTNLLVDGDLAAGKTVFAKGIGAGLGIADHIKSPSYTLLCMYEGRLPFYHFDVYRIGCIEEMDEIGYEDYFYGNGICLIEWANLIEEIIPEDAISITIEKDLEKGFDYRRIRIEGMEEL